MLHGLPAQMVLFERRLVTGNWRLVTHGNNVAAGVFYHTETPTEVVCRLADPAYYLIFAQVLTGEQTTRLEITNPTAGLLWAARQWTRTNFPQINSLTVANPGNADPAFTILNRAFAPFRHAGCNWLLNTTAADQFLQLAITSGVPIAQQPLLLGVWKLHDAQQSTTQQPNVLYGCQFTTSAGANCSVVSVQDDLFWSVARDAIRYRVTANAGTTAGQILFNAVFDQPWHANNSAPSPFTHDLIIRIASHAAETVTGDVTITAFRTSGAVAATGVVTYGPTQTVFTFPIAAGLAVSSVRVSDIAAADRFEIEVLLNVTN